MGWTDIGESAGFGFSGFQSGRFNQQDGRLGPAQSLGGMKASVGKTADYLPLGQVVYVYRIAVPGRNVVEQGSCPLCRGCGPGCRISCGDAGDRQQEDCQQAVYEQFFSDFSHYISPFPDI